MKPGIKSVLWSAAALLLMLSLLLPGINLLTILLMIVPFAVLYASLSAKAFALHVIPVLAVALVLLGTPALMLAIFFLIPAIVMGHLYRKRAPASKVLVTGTVAVLAVSILMLVGFQVVFGVSLIGEMGEMIRTTVADLHAQRLLPEQWDDELTDYFVQMTINSIPLTLMIGSFVYAVVTHYLTRRALIRSGFDIPGAAPAREWKLPRIMVVYYLIAYVLQLFVSGDSTNFIAVALLNLVPLLRFAFSVQAIGFMFFLAHQRGWNRAVPVILSIIVLLFPPLSLLGVLDAAFPIRKSITKR
ncbi:DUF2232 domain-containing protein [Paenibacillus thailandensis]|uniref:DUF2232 domain-containing protein n=1 Tax=Paenibacillus thailandensis TaxID=393250 RepID=UPI00363C07F4